MANEQTSVPLYAASEILTAANMNISAGTGVPVFATTVTRDAAFVGAGEKVLAEGQLAYIEASNIVQYYDGAAWATVGPATASGLTFITSATLATASTVINNCFSATYKNYLMLFDGVYVSAGGSNMQVKLRVSGVDSSTAYYYHKQDCSYASGAYSGVANSNVNFFGPINFVTTSATATQAAWCWVHNPFDALTTAFSWMQGETNTGRGVNNAAGFHNVATSYDGISVSLTRPCPSPVRGFL
jgi:hypothetical protein